MRNPIAVAKEKCKTVKEIAVETYEQDKTYYAFCAGSIATSAVTVVTIRYLRSKGIGLLHNPDQPIPGLRMSTDDLMKNVGASVVAVEYLNERGIRDDFREYARDYIENNRTAVSETRERLVSDLILNGMEAA